MHSAASTPLTLPASSGSQVEDIIFCYLELFAVDDALVLAELYFETARTTAALYLFAHCLMRSGQTECAYKLLLANGQTTPRLRYIFARCCYELQRLQEAEFALRKEDEAKLHGYFEDTLIEPFAHSLLSKIFMETGRTSEALEESRLGLEQNRLSWSSLKTYCDLGPGDVDSISCKLLTSVNAYRSAPKPKPPATAVSNVQNAVREKPQAKVGERLTKSAEKEKRAAPATNAPSEPLIIFAPKKQRTGVVNRKNLETGLARRRIDCGGIETRRSSRLLQDSENYSAGANDEIRGAVHGHARVSSGSEGRSPRAAQDKQLRSMNRINEMEVNRVVLGIPASPPHSTPSIHKLMDTSDSDTPKIRSTPLRRTRSGSQSALLPLSSQDQNTPCKEEVSHSLSSSATSLSSTISLRSHSQRCFATMCEKDCQSLVSFQPLTIAQLQEDKHLWTPCFVDMLECVAHLGYVQTALSRFKTSAALMRLKEMPTRCAKTPLACELTARVYLEKLDYAKCAQILQQLHVEYPYRISGMEVLSTALWHAQDARRLSMLAAELTESARCCAETWCVAGNCFSVQKQHETAVECFERAISLHPRFAYGYSLLGHELLDTDQLDRAASSFRRALSLCPTDYRAWFGLGLMHFKREELFLARVHLSRAVAVNPYNSVLLCQLSIVEHALNHNDIAVTLLHDALKISPNNAACRFYRARLLYETHDYRHCLQELEELKLLAHDEAQVFFLLGRVHKKLGDTHLALLNFSWAAEMDPRGEQSHNNLSERPYDDDPSSVSSSE